MIAQYLHYTHTHTPSYHQQNSTPRLTPLPLLLPLLLFIIRIVYIRRYIYHCTTYHQIQQHYTTTITCLPTIHRGLAISTPPLPPAIFINMVCIDINNSNHIYVDQLYIILQTTIGTAMIYIIPTIMSRLCSTYIKIY